MERTTRRQRQSGATVIEYALIAALIAVAAIGAFTFLGKEVNEKMSDVASAISGAG